MREAGVRIAVDIGGTFTDVVAERDGIVVTEKVLSTPPSFSDGVLTGVSNAVKALGAGFEDVEYLVHASTVATNALLEHRGARTGLLVTDGFGDILEIGRLRRADPYDLKRAKLPPLVPRNLVAEIPQRMNARGEVLVDLDAGAVVEAAQRLVEAGAESLAVSYLHSYVNGDHETATATLLADARVPVFASHRVVSQAREYERTTTTVIAAYLAPLVSRYIETLAKGLIALGLPANFWMMKSSGGLMTFDSAVESPHELVESGPAAGVVGAVSDAASLGIRDVITFDMGGTTAKASLVRGGTIGMNHDYEVGGAAHAGGFLRRGTGYPLRVPVVDLAEIGTGGGSIAWIDEGGALQVGPKSAGADPGPACAGRGGTIPTVTDADLVLGYISPTGSSGFLPLDLEAARAAIETHVARPLGLAVDEAARGIFELANAQMVNAVRLVSVVRGFDPRDFSFVAFGGAGPVHAWAIAAELGITSVVIPPSAGVYSAFGLLTADTTIDRSRSVRIRLDSADAQSRFGAALEELAAEADRALPQNGERERSRRHFSADMRYVGQSYEVNLPLDGIELSPLDRAALVAAFHAQHERNNGHANPEAVPEIIVLRARATIPGTPLVRAVGAASKDGTGTAAAQRTILLREGRVPFRILDAAAVATSAQDGPAVIEHGFTTTVVPPGARIETIGNGFLRMTLGGAAR